MLERDVSGHQRVLDTISRPGGVVGTEWSSNRSRSEVAVCSRGKLDHRQRSSEPSAVPLGHRRQNCRKAVLRSGFRRCQSVESASASDLAHNARPLVPGVERARDVLLSRCPVRSAWMCQPHYESRNLPSCTPIPVGAVWAESLSCESVASSRNGGGPSLERLSL